jgi:hypothetical protein
VFKAHVDTRERLISPRAGDRARTRRAAHALQSWRGMNLRHLFASVVVLSVGASACACSGASAHDPGVQPIQPIVKEPIVPQGCLPGLVWKLSSTKIEMSSFGFWDGSTGYTKDRSTMSTEQLAALDGLCTGPKPTQEGADYVSYHFRITDLDGTVSDYRAAQDDVLDSDEGAASAATVRFASLQPFLGTIHCLSASQTRNYAPDASSPWPPPANGPAFGADTGCLNGVFLPYGCAQVGVNLPVAKPGVYTLTAESCFDRTTLSIYSPDGATALATSANGSGCPSVSYRFDAAGTYPVRIDKQLASGTCDSSSTGAAGDVGIRVGYAP